MTRARWRFLALASTVGLLLMCFLPASGVPAAGPPGADKLVHLLAFFVVGYSWHRAGLGVRATIILGVCLAVGTEIGQSLLGAGRSGDVFDALADTIGLVLGVAVAARVGRTTRAEPS